VIEDLRAVLLESLFLVDPGRVEVRLTHRRRVVADRLAEDVLEVGRRVRRHDERLVARLRELRRRGRGDGALADAAFPGEEQIPRLVVARRHSVGDRCRIGQRLDVDRLVGLDIRCRADVDGRFRAVVEDAGDVGQQVEPGDLAGLERVRPGRIGVELFAGALDDGLFVLAFPLEEGSSHTDSGR